MFRKNARCNVLTLEFWFYAYIVRFAFFKTNIKLDISIKAYWKRVVKKEIESIAFPTRKDQNIIDVACDFSKYSHDTELTHCRIIFDGYGDCLKARRQCRP